MKVLIITSRCEDRTESNGLTKISENLIPQGPELGIEYTEIKIPDIKPTKPLIAAIGYLMRGRGSFQTWLQNTEVKKHTDEIESLAKTHDAVHLIGAKFTTLSETLSAETKRKCLFHIVDNELIPAIRKSQKTNIAIRAFKTLEILKINKSYAALHASKISFASKRDTRLFIKTTKLKAKTIENGVDVGRVTKTTYAPHNCNDGKYIATFHGDLTYKPNIEALHIINKVQCKKVQFRAIGKCTNDVKNALQNIRFTGYVQNLSEELAKSDIYLCPIISGAGIKNKLLEASAIGLPIIATREAAYGTGLRAGIHYYECRDAQTLQLAINTLVGHVETRMRLGMAARAHARKNFSWKISLEKFSRIYTDIGSA